MLTKLKHIGEDSIRFSSISDLLAPLPGLSLSSNGRANAFKGKIALQSYDTVDGLLQLFDYDVPNEVVLTKDNVEEAHWMVIVVEGQLDFMVGDRTYVISRGCSAVFKAKDYQIKLLGSKVKYLLYNLEGLIERTELCLDEFSLGGYRLTKEMQVKVADILFAPKSIPRPTEWLSNQLQQLLLGLMEKCREAKESPYCSDRMLGIALAAEKLIIEQYLEKVNINQRAKALGTNENTLKEAFRHHFGIGMAKLRNRLRVEEAKKLLIYTNMTVREITFKSGFETEGAMRFNFFEVTNMNPDDFSNKYKL
ncbi:helix-turn-helix domain-containing protein [Flavihumibacter sp. ZG627]|uniref:helix-turn-helix domain-containing protein n=1 Tax=Flavihumibacter sp. ZG627 TaxID=1463156 RepID=UPI00057DD624|nr:helix-turn-helix domain-containing protein [Flavihumibacter sp. ZG627]KIC89115.1 hypothetical protein HY58_18550 [Flavihumibacter sp. ZG627]